MTDERDPESITEHLDALLESLHGPGRASLGGVFGRWDEVVGATIAAHVRPVRLDRAVLTVEVSEPSWATQLAFLVDDLRTRLIDATGANIERIEVRVARPRRPPGRE